jgi:23S rRNA (uridine2552-2'-O)-methyltransferase
VRNNILLMPGNYNRKDYLYEKAKQEGYRSRAAFKLKELNQKFSLIKHDSRTLDLGAWPGGWLQVASELMGAGGVAVGIDLVEIEQFADPRVHVLKGDVRDEQLLKQALDLSGRLFDTVLSDMSPKLSGIPEVDHNASVALNELAAWTCQYVLRPAGNFVAKVFKSNESEQFIRSLRPSFNKIVRSELDSTRKTSNEFYVIGLGYKGSHQEFSLPG